jgi:electron transfer flavoprotein alpha/beta subunit
VLTVDENLNQPKLITMEQLHKDVERSKKARKAYTREEAIEVFKNMKNFNLNKDFKRELERGLCPVLQAYPNLNIEGLTEGKEMRKASEDKIKIDENVSGITLKGHPMKKEPFQKDAW